MICRKLFNFYTASCQYNIPSVVKNKSIIIAQKLNGTVKEENDNQITIKVGSQLKTRLWGVWTDKDDLPQKIVLFFQPSQNNMTTVKIKVSEDLGYGVDKKYYEALMKTKENVINLLSETDTL